ncbi:MAG: hypothetical protein LBI20_03820 [Holosporales bacterium]|nr:hypothetical protein [Holosporales bacterium]
MFWTILNELKQEKLEELNIVFVDSTTIKLHKHGCGTLKKNKAPQNISKKKSSRERYEDTRNCWETRSNPSFCITGVGVRNSKPAQEALYSLNLNGVKMFLADKAYDTNNTC